MIDDVHLILQPVFRFRKIVILMCRKQAKENEETGKYIKQKTKMNFQKPILMKWT